MTRLRRRAPKSRDHAEEDQLRERGAERARAASSDAIAPAVGISVGRLERARAAAGSAPPASIEPVASTGPGRLAREAELAVDAGRGVEDRGEHDGERARDRPRVAGRARRRRRTPTPTRPSTTPAIREPRRSARAAGSAARSAARRSAPSPARSPRRRSRCAVSPQATSQNGSAALSAPSTSASRQALAQARPTAVAAPSVDDAGTPSSDGSRRAAPAAAISGAGREAAVDADLDEQVRRAPERREHEDERASSCASSVVEATLDRGRARRASPVASAVPPSTSARPASAVAVTASSRKTAP